MVPEPPESLQRRAGRAGRVHPTRNLRPAAPRRRQSRRQRARSLLARLKPLAAFTAAVTLATTITGLAFEFFPDLRPDPEVETSATLKIIDTEFGATYRRYSRLVGRRGTLDSGATTGNMFFVEIETKGTKGRTGLLIWCVMDAKTRTRSRDLYCSDLRPRPGTTSDRFLVPVWFQPPVDPGTYFLRFEYHAKGALLAITDSPPFGPCTEPSCGFSSE